MARSLVVKSDVRIEHPDDPDLWFVVRVPLSSGNLANMRDERSALGNVLDVAADVVTEWCYDEPITQANLDRLPIDDFKFLSQKINELSGIRSDDQKKDSPTPSSPTSSTEESGPTNSDT